MNTKICFSIVIAFVIGITTVVNAQNAPAIKFDSLSHHFGKIKEEGGKVSAVFPFQNTGTDTLKIVSVTAGYGSTASEWTKTPVLPGKMGYVRAEYDPKGKPGPFTKGITVSTNAKGPGVLLTIKGEVVPHLKTVVDSFPVPAGNLLMKSNHLNFQTNNKAVGTIKNTDTKTDTLEVYNNWKKPMNIAFSNVPAFATCKAVPETLLPGKRGKIIVTYDAAKKNDFGLVYDFVNINTNDSAEAVKQITLSANIVEDFSKMTEKQKKDAPKIVFTTDSYDFGTIKAGEKVKFSFEVKNDGNDDLIIRKTKASCGCTASKPEKSTLKKGETSKIDIEFNSTGKKGEQHKTVTVISNDPDKSSITLNIKGSVTPKDDPVTK